MSKPVRLLVASLGNPPPYHSTRHSAGHILLRSLASSLSFPALTKSRDYAGGLVAVDYERPEFTLWQSPSLMNISGASLLKAWKQFDALYSNGSQETTTGLVILHDELESASGQLKLKKGDGSAKGHNGIKSVQQSLQSSGILAKLAQGGRFIKIGVGIGRPSSREKDDVSEFVLGQLSTLEKAKLESAAGQLQVLLEKEVERLGRD